MAKKHTIIRLLRNGAGAVLLALGLVGLFLPVLQGILFLVVGLGLIDLPVKRRAHRWLRHRWTPYRWLALRHHRVKRSILQKHRARKRTRRGKAKRRSLVRRPK